MGAIIAQRGYFIDSITDSIGFKSGLALSLSDLKQHCPDASFIWDGKKEDVLRVRAEEISSYISQVLYAIGNIDTAHLLPLGLHLYKEFGSSADLLELVPQLLSLFTNLSRTTEEPLSKQVFLEAVEAKFGSGEPVEIADVMFKHLIRTLHADPFSGFRIIEWQDVADLEDLFSSESLDPYYGNFIDQRFINYLASNFEAISKMHWRKFEGLVGEFFARAGFSVKMGPGRGDGNVDIRVWPNKESQKDPPLIIIQCKRQKGSVEKVVVKALWADIVDEGANSGLIATTSSLSPGAKQVRTARKYPIYEADRQTLRTWLTALRVPLSGTSLLE